MQFTPSMGETMMHTSEVHELAVSLKEKAIAKKFKNRIAVTPPDWTQNLCKSTDDLNVNIPKSWRVPDIDRVLIDCPDINFKAAGVSKKYEVYEKSVCKSNQLQIGCVYNIGCFYKKK